LFRADLRRAHRDAAVSHATGVTIGLRAAGIRVVLLDIEGTTTPITFVHDTLFPYARARVRSWLTSTPATDPDVREIVSGLASELRAEGRQLDPASWDVAAGTWQLDVVVARVNELMDADRKSRALKTLQGRIWEDGYTSGELKGAVYPDVPDALERWTSAGIGVGIFSSGSVLAQILLFANSTAGDLTRFLRWHFDTAVGPKLDASSYRQIVRSLDVDAPSVLFISDVTRELDAARDAGLATVLAVRPPATGPTGSSYRVIESFKEIEA
jgi:2,3-diketo-5-methylthio-1-phosphopentane phosphatase